MREERIERPGATVKYSVSGSGPALVLGHSLFCNRTMWAQVAPALEERFTVINVALRGHGESTATAPFSIWDLAGDWAAILDREEIQSASLCGLSTGGMTAMRFAVTKPERVDALALLDTDAGSEKPSNRVQYTLLGQAYRFTGWIPLGTLTEKMFAPKTVAERPDLVSDLVGIMRRHDRSQLRHAMKAIFGRDSVDVSSISAPTVIIVGEHDAATPPSRSRHLHETIKGSRLEIIKDAGHLSALEQPDAVNAVLLDFFAELAPEKVDNG